jgi:hypothetical protein
VSDYEPIRHIIRDDYVIGHRWWSPEELGKSSEDFVPQRLPVLVGDIFEGLYPDGPIECGV